MRFSRVGWVALGGCAVAALAFPALSQGGSAPVARYTVDAGTTSGMAAMGAGGGGVGAAMAMLRGGGGQVVHELQLRLGSTRAPAGEPRADHFLPQGTGLGQSVPLETPPPPRAGRAEPGEMPQQGQLPRGRLLLFWGCGEHAPAGQPVVIDFSKLAQGQVPPGLYASGLNLPEDWEVRQSNATTFGEWPNRRDSKPVPANASLLGAHRIASSYAPEISFTLADDFMPPLQPTSRELPSGAVDLRWNALPKATGYYAWAMGARMDESGDAPRDMVWWASSATQSFGGALADWLSPAAVSRLVADRTVMPPSQTNCTVPAEVKQAGGEMLMTQLYGYGPQADFAYPPRPADSRVAWRPEWIARVRFRANASVMLGMPAMGGFETDDSDRAAESDRAPQQSKPKCPGGLTGRAMRAAGVCE